MIFKNSDIDGSKFIKKVLVSLQLTPQVFLNKSATTAYTKRTLMLGVGSRVTEVAVQTLPHTQALHETTDIFASVL